jgi:hypothetical protein
MRRLSKTLNQEVTSVRVSAASDDLQKVIPL